jgi:ferredoxin
MKITIDGDRCAGHGLCYVAAPDLFADDDRGFGQVTGDGQAPPEQHDEAHAAAATCPELAVVLTE